MFDKTFYYYYYYLENDAYNFYEAQVQLKKKKIKFIFKSSLVSTTLHLNCKLNISITT